MVEALLAHKPLFARNIEPLNICRRYFSHQQLLSYNDIAVPWSCPLLKKKKKQLMSRYVGKIRALHKFYSHATIQSLSRQLDALFSQPTVDFSYLDIASHINIVGNSDRAMLAELYNHNREIIHATYNTLQVTHTYRPDIPALIDDYGSQKFSDTVNALIDRLTCEETSPNTRVDRRIDTCMREAYIDISYIRLLIN